MQPLSVVITGSSTGFGFRSAKQMADAGHRVFATMREASGRNASHAQALRDHATGAKGSIEVVELDVTSDASVQAAVDGIAAEAGRIDVLVSNAGIWGPGVLEAYTLEQWREMFEVNVFGSVRAVRAAAPHMRAQRSGLIIQISSLQGRFILPYSGPYVASKWAVEGALETFRYELAPHGVEVVIVEPYDFMTEMKAKARDHQPADHEREAAYGATVDMIRQMYLVPDPTRAGDPQLVVDAIQGVIDAPRGQRPGRITVSNPIPQIEAINTLTDEMHAALYPYIGMQGLLKVAP
jgi:NAD(P)-dependent dehydrogenase (short-subunit alcohol dehydrogenase family)